ncbi:MAG: polysaccharide deacetylase family protein [Alphaproteobacteria bacterium]|nr:polysaccharide deacetylase family protein [Alphaproteobacteria bacterium]
MILTYHNIGKGNNKTYITLESFQRQIQDLKDANFEVVKFEDYNLHNAKHVILTFDDGRKNILDILPILQKNKWPFYVFLVGDLLGSSDEFLSEADFEKITKAGGILGWHTKSHPDLTTLNSRKIRQELQNPYGFKYLAYPYWKSNEKVVKIAKKMGYTYARSGNGFAHQKFGCFSLDSQFIQEHTNVKYINNRIVKFLDCYIPVKTCNFKCHYCYITQNKWWGEKLPEFKYSPEYISKALSKERMGGICLVNLCGGGETLLPPEMTDIVRCLLQEGHYVMIVTNCTVTKRIDEILSLDKELLKRLFFKCSFQYLELKRTKLMDRFFDNIRKIKSSPASFTVELTVVDELVPHIQDIKDTCMKELGALCHLTIARDETKPTIPRLSDYSEDEFAKIWNDFDSEMFRFKLPLFEKKRHEFCYAGCWSYLVNFENGDLSPCYGCSKIQNIFEDVSSPIKSCPVGCHCPNPHCWNNHAFLCFGDIIGFKAPTFAQIRDRVCSDGSHWLKPEFLDIFNQRLDENNPHLSEKEMRQIEKDYNKKPFKYYKYKFLSKITLGKIRKKYKKKLKNIK